MSGINMYHRAKFHAGQYHRRRDNCNRTIITADLTIFAFVQGRQSVSNIVRVQSPYLPLHSLPLTSS